MTYCVQNGKGVQLFQSLLLFTESEILHYCSPHEISFLFEKFRDIKKFLEQTIQNNNSCLRIQIKNRHGKTLNIRVVGRYLLLRKKSVIFKIQFLEIDEKTIKKTFGYFLILA